MLLSIEPQRSRNGSTFSVTIAGLSGEGASGISISSFQASKGEGPDVLYLLQPNTCPLESRINSKFPWAVFEAALQRTSAAFSRV